MYDLSQSYWELLATPLALRVIDRLREVSPTPRTNLDDLASPTRIGQVLQRLRDLHLIDTIRSHRPIALRCPETFENINRRLAVLPARRDTLQSLRAPLCRQLIDLLLPGPQRRRALSWYQHPARVSDTPKLMRHHQLIDEHGVFVQLRHAAVLGHLLQDVDDTVVDITATRSPRSSRPRAAGTIAINRCWPQNVPSSSRPRRRRLPPR